MNKKSKKIIIILIVVISLLLVSYILIKNIIIRKNLNEYKESIEKMYAITVFIDYEITETQKIELGNKIKNLNYVDTIKYKSEEDALKEMREKFPNQKSLFESYEKDNPFHAYYVVTLTDLTKAEQLEKQIEKLDFVSSININSDLLEKYNDIKSILNRIII